MTTDREPPPIPSDRLPLAQSTAEWLLRQSPRPRPVIPALMEHKDLTVTEALAALRIANAIRDKVVPA